MSGQRLTKALAAGTDPAPKTRDVRANRAREYMAVKYAAATSQADRLSVAADYIRAVVKDVGPQDAAYTEKLVRTVTEQLVGVGDQINELRRRR